MNCWFTPHAYDTRAVGMEMRNPALPRGSQGPIYLSSNYGVSKSALAEAAIRRQGFNPGSDAHGGGSSPEAFFF